MNPIKGSETARNNDRSREAIKVGEKWLNSLQTIDAQEGYELAIKLARIGVKYTQPSDDIRKKLRPIYAENADSLIASSQVIAINFQTVAAANDYWRA